MQDTKATDIDLITRIASSDKVAMQTFFMRHHASLHSFLVGLGATRNEADDLVQETMLQVWNAADSFQGRSNPKTWMFRIARNKFIDGLRKSKRLSYVDTVPEPDEIEQDAQCSLIQAQDAARIQHCLDELKPPQKAIMRMAFYDDLTYAEIADVLQTAMGTVKSRVFHAKQLLMRCLGQEA